MIFEEFLKHCNGVTVTTKQEINHILPRPYNTYECVLHDKNNTTVTPNGDFYIEIQYTATEGTVAKIVGVELNVRRSSKGLLISKYKSTFLYETEDRPGRVGRINVTYTKILDSPPPKTFYKRKVKSHKKVKIETPVNKYKQELKRGDWVVGVMPGKRLGIGRITRWTNHNIWAVRDGNIDEKKNPTEFKFDSIAETFVMPNDDHTALLTLAVLKGWDGR